MKGTKTSLFLIELMIALLLFAFCAAICIQLFHASNARTESADDLSNAVFQATTAAELYKSVGGDLAALADRYDDSSVQFNSGKLTLYFDEEWNLTYNPMFSATRYVTAYRVDVSDNGGSADIMVSKLVQEYYEYTVSNVYKEIFVITVKAVNA